MKNSQQLNKLAKESLTQLAAGKNAVQLKDNRPIRKNSLPDDLKSGIEQLSGHSMDDVKVHYNSDKPAQLQALAYAQGTNIHIAPGQEKHLPHEAWHVAQQKQGRVQPTMQMKGNIHINDDRRLESEADLMGQKALHISPIQFTKGSRAAGEKKGKTQKEIKKQKEQSKNARSFNNLKYYRPLWVTRNDVSEETVKEFLKGYLPGKIRGHASGDNSQGEQKVTQDDLTAYRHWHTRTYGWR